MNRMLVITAIYIVALMLACLKAEARVDIDFIDRHGKNYVIVETDNKVCVTEVTEELRKFDIDTIVKKTLANKKCVQKAGNVSSTED